MVFPDQALLDVLMLPELHVHEKVLLVSVQYCNGQLCKERVIKYMCCASSIFSSHAAIKVFRLQHLLCFVKWSTTGSLFNLTQSCSRFQVPIDPIGKLPGLLDALKLMDAAVQQNMYHEKLLMYRNVRMPDQDKVTLCIQIVPAGHCLAELPVGRYMLSCAAAPIIPYIAYPICTCVCHS